VNALYNQDFDSFENNGANTLPLGVGLAAIAVGAVIGAAAALLLAPKSGQDLRSQLLAHAGNWRSVAADTISSGREKLVSSVEEEAKR